MHVCTERNTKEGGQCCCKLKGLFIKGQGKGV
jgi:hypothetical protein